MDLVESTPGLSDGQVRHPWETARLGVIRRLIARHVSVGDGSVVIDIGCGDAFVVSALAESFPTARFYGIDAALTPGLIARTRARKTMPNVQLAQSLDTLAPTPTRPATLVLLMDVIEHVEDDDAFLKDLLGRAIIDRNTCLLVTVPAYSWLFSAHDVFLRHHRRYSRRALQRRLEHAGLRVMEGGYFFLSLMPLRALKVIKEHLFGRPEATASGLMDVPGPTSAAILSRVLIADGILGLGLGRVGLTIPGLSSYAICRKSA